MLVVLLSPQLPKVTIDAVVVHITKDAVGVHISKNHVRIVTGTEVVIKVIKAVIPASTIILLVAKVLKMETFGIIVIVIVARVCSPAMAIVEVDSLNSIVTIIA